MLAPLLSGLLALLVIEIWDARRAVPFTGYASDGLLYLAMVKSMLEHGWFQENPSVAWPFGQELYDFPSISGDNLNFALIKVLGLFSGDPSFLLNLFVLATFPLVGLAAFLVFRRLGLAQSTAVVCAVLFALLPYHFVRALNGHVMLAAYYAVPFGFYLAVTVLSGEPLWSRAPEKQGWRAHLTLRSAATVAMCVLLATTGIYYALFTLILVAIAGAVATVSMWRLRPLARAGGLIALLGVLLAVNFAPNVVYRVANGENNAVAQRNPAESEAFATKLTHLLLPIPHHRLGPLADLTAEYQSAPVPPPPDYGVSLGTFGAIGFIALLVVLLAGGRRALPETWRWRRLHDAAVIAVVTFLFVTVGGFSSLFAFEVNAQLRGWYRLSIFISFAALLAVGLLLDAARASPKSPALLRRGFPAVLALVLTLGVLDQTGRDFIPDYDAVETSFRNDREFVGAIEARLPAGSEVFQLPYVSFPETLLNRIDASEPARGYLHSKDLEWSWGSMRGRDEDWQALLADDPPRRVARSVAAAGFDGLWVDRWGYTDNGAGIEARLRAELGAPDLESGDRRFAFYDLRPLRSRLERESSERAVERLARSTLNPN